MKTLLSILLLAAMVATAQTPAPPATTSLVQELSDPLNVGLVTYSLSQIADSTTDWNVTLAGKDYHVSPVQRTAFAGGSMFAAIALSHYFPSTKRYVTAALAIGSAILAGRAYAHTLTHETPAVPVATAQAITAKGTLFSFRIRR